MRQYIADPSELLSLYLSISQRQGNQGHCFHSYNSFIFTMGETFMHRQVIANGRQNAILCTYWYLVLELFELG